MNFDALWAQIGPFSLLGPAKARVVHELCLDALKRLPEGDVAECGVYLGGTAALMGILLKKQGKKRKLWLFDSFVGLPEVDPKVDCYYTGHGMSGDGFNIHDVVRRVMKDHGLDSRAQIRKGWFKTTLPKIPKSVRFCFVHVDCDIYSSTQTVLRYLYPLLLEGGIMVFDDYFDIGGGQRLAVNEFVRETGDLLFAGWPQQAYFIKGRKLQPDDEPFLISPKSAVKVPVQSERLLKNRNSLRMLYEARQEIGAFYPNPKTIKFILSLQRSALELDSYFEALFRTSGSDS